MAEGAVARLCSTCGRSRGHPTGALAQAWPSSVKPQWGKRLAVWRNLPSLRLPRTGVWVWAEQLSSATGYLQRGSQLKGQAAANTCSSWGRKHFDLQGGDLSRGSGGPHLFRLWRVPKVVSWPMAVLLPRISQTPFVLGESRKHVDGLFL